MGKPEFTLTLEDSLKTLTVARNILGTVGLMFGAYIFVKSIPGVVRYVRIVRM